MTQRKLFGLGPSRILPPVFYVIIDTLSDLLADFMYRRHDGDMEGPISLTSRLGSLAAALLIGATPLLLDVCLSFEYPFSLFSLMYG